MAGRDYRDDTTVDDIQSGDQLWLECPCGHNSMPAWRRIPKAQQFTPLKDLRRKMVCRRCGQRAPNLVIYGFDGVSSALHVQWCWPAGARQVGARRRDEGA
ncbi:MAG: hypothetical protein Q7J26_01845 [Brevundimonas sp.]|uniref:hypothetical protein n=1 Tax=Brevundimonas sp. TaxID=1871086 RepID=UPI002724C676|nr:hypothetical protein [Brevundimonas sp.]MDO9607240.1 hypothetical protein [Brevundimonas sp.]